ncbi:MAG TPA: monomeric [FeFe] hydrogenase [Candidatus Ozemobacteraceae bacterium]
MLFENDATRIRREVMVRIARAFLEGNLVREIDRIPLEMRPRNAETVSRCCVYKDRAVIRYRCLAALGVGFDEEKDELTPLSAFAQQALDRKKIEGPVLSVLEIACHACVKAHHKVTDACQGCIARPCVVNCPKKAVSVVDGVSRIDPKACVNCGKCQKVCPFNAIVKIPVPCEQACPVGAIAKDAQNRSVIDFDRCVSCGRCMRACPFGAVLERSELLDVLKALRGPRPVVAILAPAVVGQFPGSLEQIVAGMKRLGFSGVVEVAHGADLVARAEAAEFAHRMRGGATFMTSSCCPAYVQAAKRHVPGLMAHVSDTPTPMHVSAEEVRKRNPEAFVTFVGPCVAKRFEGRNDPMIDAVLTFEELGALFIAGQVDVAACPEEPLEQPASAEGRGFAIQGGVTKAVQAYASPDTPLKPVYINGLTRTTLLQLKAFLSSCPGNFVEVMVCEGGCVAGAGVVGQAQVSAQKIRLLTDSNVTRKAGG